MKTVSEILKKTVKGDILVSGKRKWLVGDKFDGAIVASPANKSTTFELWSHGIENVAVIPGLKIIKKDK